MNRYRRIEVILIIVLVLILTAGNLALLRNDDRSRPYRVDAKRVASRVAEEGIENISIDEYQYVKAVVPYDPDDTPNGDYLITVHDGTIYAVIYETTGKDPVITFNIFAGLMLLISAGILIYVDRKVLKPFNSMSEMTVDLAKGNLSRPIKEEKSRFFGKYLWGMDMLRENLEDSKRRELEYQKEKKTLVLSLSHDIKTPLSAIELYARAMKDGLYDTPGKKEQAIDGILKNTDEIKRYAGEIAKVSREDFLELKVDPSEIYLKDVMTKIEVYYGERLSSLHTGFTVDSCDNCMLNADPDRLVEVIQNLMENAIKYGDGVSVHISFDDEEDCKLITVENTGECPDDKDMQNLFDSFYRGKNSSKVNGSGLGLYIARNLMRKMGGDVYAKAGDGVFAITVVVRKA